VRHMGAVLGLLMGEMGAPETLIRLSEAYPADACVASMAAIGAASIDDAETAITAQQRAREAAPGDPQVAFLSWWLGMESPETLVPVLERGLAEDPGDPGSWRPPLPRRRPRRPSPCWSGRSTGG
jgi:hypothetical protein